VRNSQALLFLAMLIGVVSGSCASFRRSPVKSDLIYLRWRPVGEPRSCKYKMLHTKIKVIGDLNLKCTMSKLIVMCSSCRVTTLKFKYRHISSLDKTIMLLRTKCDGDAITGTRLSLTDQETVNMERNFRLNPLSFIHVSSTQTLR